jgi:hypothetical protein
VELHKEKTDVSSVSFSIFPLGISRWVFSNPEDLPNVSEKIGFLLTNDNINITQKF